MERWTFGVEPLQQTVRAAALIRRVSALLLALEGDEPEVDDLIAVLQALETSLLAQVPSDSAPRIGPAASGQGRAYIDHARDVGAFNPSFPEYTIEVNGQSAKGSITFPINYEGPPGLVHGGFLAVFFDCVVQHHNCDVGVAGRTTSLALRYRRPVPLLTPLTFTIDRTVTEGRIRSVSQLSDADQLLCEAEVDAKAGDRATLPEVSPRRENQ